MPAAETVSANKKTFNFIVLFQVENILNISALILGAMTLVKFSHTDYDDSPLTFDNANRVKTGPIISKKIVLLMTMVSSIWA